VPLLRQGFQARWQAPESGHHHESGVPEDMPHALDDLRHGKFRSAEPRPKQPDAVPTTLGVTPYYKTNDPNYPQRTYASAKALFDEPDWKATFNQFEADVRDLAKQHHVKLDSLERNVGVFEGEYEPSYAIKVSGTKAKVRALNRALGQKWKQDAVVSFKRDKDGTDAEAHITGIKDSDEFYAKLRDRLGDDAGASFDADGVRVFIYGADTDQMKKIRDIVQATSGAKVRFARGSGDYIETKGT
jgi:hypothetical protein